MRNFISVSVVLSFFFVISKNFTSQISYFLKNILIFVVAIREVATYFSEKCFANP